MTHSECFRGKENLVKYRGKRTSQDVVCIVFSSLNPYLCLSFFIDMIKFDRFTLHNGLRVLVHEDKSTPMAAVNLLYKVGAKYESPDKTGFAHLFEHLMFAGSKNVENFDEPLQWAGGDSNAFTNSDVTSFYATVPAQNLETVFWLESDRMVNLNINAKSLEVQRKVVLEEFKETCLNQPYGDVWHHLVGLAYKVHPYRWPTIGLTPEHVESATLSDVHDFFRHYYHPGNAILVVSGNVTLAHVRELVEKWFGDIAAHPLPEIRIPSEPKQHTQQINRVSASVPNNALYMAFHMDGRCYPSYYTSDLLSDVLSRGRSSRLYQRLLKDRRLFSEIDAYVTGNTDPGLFVVEGKPAEGVSLETAEKAIWEELDLLKTDLTEKRELQKIKNKVESSLVFSETNILTKAINLAIFEAQDNADLINNEAELYRNINAEDLRSQAQCLFKKENCSELFYMARK